MYKKTIKEVFKETSSQENGLSSAEAQKRLTANGLNKLKETPKATLAQRIIEHLKDPMIIVLIIAAIVAGITGLYEGHGLTDSIIILIVVVVNTVMGVIQESKAEEAIDALSKMSMPTTKVYRDNKLQTINSEEVVVGDIILLEAGDSISADGRVIESATLQTIEAALTGESTSVDKTTKEIKKDNLPLGDTTNMAFLGTTVAYGRGKMLVTGVGMNTEMGKIADALNAAHDEQTPLQISLAKLSKQLTFIVIGISIFIFGFKMLTADVINIDLTLDFFMIAVSLAVAAIPEGLATVVTIVLSLGVTRMSKENAIIRKLSAVETLGCTQIICSDKTGTLTQNKMTVVDSFGDEQLLATAMTQASDAIIEDNEAVGEPTECAVVNWAHSLKIKQTLDRVDEIPFDSDRKLMTVVYKPKKYLQYTKGAPDELLKVCTHINKDGKVVALTTKLKTEINKAYAAMAEKQLRVLAAAYQEYDKLPKKLESGLIFVGLAGMIDPVREEVYPAMESCFSAGIQPIMITGDHKSTAGAIAKDLGLITDESQVLTGADLDKLSDKEFMKIIKNTKVYARVNPENKIRIVMAWKKLGYVVAMTGDGVNDAPSIKSSDIGIGMGITGTDVTKSVADMILADDNFATIVIAVKEGRRIYTNITKAVQFLLATNLAEVMTVFFATILGFTIFKPVHLLWINLVTDTFPAIALGMEDFEANIMNKKPRDTKEPLLNKRFTISLIYQGCFMTLLILASYLIGNYLDTGIFSFNDNNVAITMAFITMSLIQIFHSFNMRSQKDSLFSIKHQNKMLWYSAIFTIFSTLAVVFVPFLRDAFSLAPITSLELGIALGLAFMMIPLVEISKFIKSKIMK
ncbi:MAG: cation-translocating P-type ATPase [Erysipelotrichaceae bacterium]